MVNLINMNANATGDDDLLVNSTNFTVDGGSGMKEKPPLLMLYDVLIPAIGVFVIGLNLLVVISSGFILKKKRHPRATYFLLGNLALADLMTGIAVVFGQATPEQARGFFLCTLQIGLIVSSTLESVFSIGLIAVDRYLYILHGLNYQKWLNPFRTKALVLLTWIIAATIGFLPMMGWNDYTDGRCWFVKLAPKHLILLTVLVGSVPLLIVIILYGIILYPILMSPASQPLKNVSPAGSDAGGAVAAGPKRRNVFMEMFMKRTEHNLKGSCKWKAIKVVVLVTMCFTVTWVPYFVASLMYVFTDESSRNGKRLAVLIASPLAILGFFNSLLNPFIYAWWHPGFRNSAYKLMCCRRKRGGGGVNDGGNGGTDDEYDSDNAITTVESVYVRDNTEDSQKK